MLHRVLIPIFLVMLISCDQASVKTANIVYYKTGCDEYEISSDIEESISGVVDYARDHSIDLVEVTSEGKCGYVLTGSQRDREIHSALTDVDLLQEIKDYYGAVPRK